MTKKRSEEIGILNRLSVDEIIEMSKEHLIVTDSIDQLHILFAEHMCALIENNNKLNLPTAGVFPFGPVGQYPYFIEMVNKRQISLANTHFFFMDEYADENGIELPQEHNLSFRGKLFEMFKNIDKSLLPDFSKIIFPMSSNIDSLKEKISAMHMNITYGGIGIHGHIAFNEPETGVRNSDPRIVALNDFTVTINSIRDNIGGDLENFPRKALTLGMNQLFASDTMILFCRNGTDSIAWANTVLRLALLGTPGDDYPVTYLKEHKDWLIVTDRDTLTTPIKI